METYKIMRFFFKRPNKTIHTGLTLKEAQEHCNDPLTSSKTHPEGESYHKYNCPWFDGYEQE